MNQPTGSTPIGFPDHMDQHSQAGPNCFAAAWPHWWSTSLCSALPTSEHCQPLSVCQTNLVSLATADPVRSGPAPRHCWALNPGSAFPLENPGAISWAVLGDGAMRMTTRESAWILCPIWYVNDLEEYYKDSVIMNHLCDVQESWLATNAGSIPQEREILTGMSM